jgi:two-component system nitrogen regulation response regulator GlnG
VPTDLYASIITQIEKPLIELTLEYTGGNQLKAADVLGINRNTLRKKITDLKIEVKKGAGG